MRKKNREGLETVAHTHSIYGKENRAMVESVYSTESYSLFDMEFVYSTISTILQNEERCNLTNKVRVGRNSTLKSIYKNKKESIMLEN